MRLNFAATISALYLLVWFVLVCNALILSSLTQLGNLSAYITVSLILAVIITVLLRRMNVNVPIPEAVSNQEENYKTMMLGRRVAWMAISFVVIPTILISTFYISNNLAQGSLSQVPGDFRITFYPFNISLVYVSFAIHGLAGAWFNLFGFITWLVGGIAVWRFARDIGAGYTSALIASAIFITSPAVLVSASSTNDDMIVGVPLLIGIMFLARWWKSNSWFDAILAAIGVGLALGSKLHWVMMLPIVVILLVNILYKLKSKNQLKYFIQPKLRQIIVAACLVLILTLPVFIINWVESGQFTPSIPELVNYPFSLVVASVHSIVSTVSMLLGSIPDLYIAYSSDARQSFGVGFNNWFNNLFFFWLTDDLNYITDGFVFSGIGSNIANLGVNEATVWIGLTPWLLGLVILLLLRKNNKRFQQFALWLALIFFAWHFTRTFMLKWVMGEGIYYAFSIALAAPAVAYLWEHRSTGPNARIKEGIIKGICITVLATNLISAINYFIYNYQRNLRTLYVTHFNPEQKLLTPQVGEVLRNSRRTMITYNQWGLPYFRLINENPSARYATARVLPALSQKDYDLILLMSSSTIPIEFENDDRNRLSWFGHYGFNKFQTFFGYGPVVDKLALNQTEEKISPAKFALLKQSNIQRNSNGSITSIKFSKLIGIGKDEEFLISATLVTPSFGVTKILETELFSSNVTVTIPTEQSEGYLIIKLMRRDQPDIKSHIWLPLSYKQTWLNINPKQRWLDINKNGLINYTSDDLSGKHGFVSGWKPQNINSYHLMNSQSSEISFPILKGFSKCSMGIGMISHGKGDINIYLNDKILSKIQSSEIMYSKNYKLALPDYIATSDKNHIRFIKNNKDGVPITVGLNFFSIDCAVFKGAKIY